MKPPINILGSWLEDDTICNNTKIRGCLSILELAKDPATQSEIPLHALGKSVCHLAYRSLEGQYPHFKVNDVQTALANMVMMPTEPHIESRWKGSMAIAAIYMSILNNDAKNGSWLAYVDMFLPKDIENNPTGAVNACRANALAAAFFAGDGDGGKEYADRCFEMFKVAAEKWPYTGGSDCGGIELVQAANAVNICIRLAPYIRNQFIGAVGRVGDIATSCNSPFFGEALKKVIGWNSF